MADPTALIGAILFCIKEITVIVEDIREMDQRFARLVERVVALEEPVKQIERGSKSCSTNALSQVRALLENASAFLRVFSKSSKIRRAMNRWVSPAVLRRRSYICISE